MSWFNKHNEAENISVKHIENISQKILKEIESKYRFKEINHLKFSPHELETGLTQSAIKLYTETVNASNPVYKKIQHLEAGYSELKSELDNKLYYELKNLEDKSDELEDELKEKRSEVKKLNVKKIEIEDKFNKVEDKKVQGSLFKISGWWFMIIMAIVGYVELEIYQNVFLSQEIGLKADMSAEDQHIVKETAMRMAVGFTAMIIWMAHSLGSILRHFPNTTVREKLTNILYIFVILTVTGSAIWATVDIRGKMHNILAYDQKVADLNEKIDRSSDAMFGDSDTEEDSENVFGDEEEDESDEDTFGDDTEAEEETGFGEDEISVPKERKSKVADFEVLKDEYREKARMMKGETADVFMIINIFIFIGGVILSYFSHTSSPAYETILKSLKYSRKEENKLEKRLSKIDKSIIAFKKRIIAPLFEKLLTEAAQYDLQARIYNTYIETFQMQLKIIETYIKDLFAQNSMPYKDMTSEVLIEKYISIGKRKELHNVHTNLEEYMIYNYTRPKDMDKEEKVNV